MTSKKRVRTALARHKPDRMPCMVTFNTDTQNAGIFRVDDISAKEKILSYFETDDYETVLKRLGIDIRCLSPRAPQAQGTDWYEELSAAVRKAETLDDLRKITQPTWEIMWDCRHMREDLLRIKELGDYAIQLSGAAIWEVARGARGFDQILVDWLTQPEFVLELFEMVYRLYIPAFDVIAEELGDLVGEVDYIYSGSDFGLQDRLMIAPALFERDYEPIVRRECEKLKELFPNAFYEFHCCGSIVELLPSFIRAGVECIHPVQPAAKGMDFEFLKSTFGDRLAFRGGVDGQGVLSRGKPEDVRQSVLNAFHTLGKGGGFIISPHGIMPEVPPENVDALFKTVREECWYS